MAKKKAKKLNARFLFLFMRAEGSQLGKITQLIEADIIKPVIDKVFPFEQSNEAMDFLSGPIRLASFSSAVFPPCRFLIN